MSTSIEGVHRLAESAARLMGVAVRHAERVHGGDLSQVIRVALADGRDTIVKSAPSPATEAAMLRAIAATGAPAPRVLAVGDATLVLELLPSGGALHGAWASLGRAAALLHAAAGPRYGWGEDYGFGSVAIPNGWAEDWPGFWAERRLLPHLPMLAPDLARRVARLACALAERLPARPRPTLLHGDLWGGNVLVAGNEVSGLIDPACYHGHAEVDIAMLCLFDRPDAAFFEAYGELERGHAERLAIYQLWPALVHLRLFGDGYRPLVERLLSAAGS